MILVIIDYLIRTIFISFLEQSFFTLMSIRFLKSEILMTRTGRIKTIVAIVIPAFISNLPRTIGIDPGISMLCGIITTSIAIGLLTGFYIPTNDTIQKMVLKAIGGNTKLFLCVLFSIMIFMVTEAVGINFIIYSTKLTTHDFNVNVVLAIEASLFERIIQTIIVYLVFIKKRGRYLNKYDIDIIDIIKSSKKERKLAIVTLSLDIVYLLLIAGLLMFNKILIGVNPFIAIFACLLIIAVPVSSIMCYLESVYRNYVKNESYVNLYAEQMKDKMRDKIKHALNCAIESGDFKTIEAIANMMNAIEEQ